MNKDQVAPLIRIYYDVRTDQFVLWSERTGLKLEVDVTERLNKFVGDVRTKEVQGAEQ